MLSPLRFSSSLTDRFSSRMPSEGSRKAGEPRLVTVRRPGVEVGVTLCGGNLRGVYIESLDEDSPARGPDGLLPGDLILEVRTQIHRTHNLLNKSTNTSAAIAQNVHVQHLSGWRLGSLLDGKYYFPSDMLHTDS